MVKLLHNTPVFRMIGKFDQEKQGFIYHPETVCADVYKITVGTHSRLICAFRNKSRWIPMDVLTGIALQGAFTTKTTALQAIAEYFEGFLNPEFPQIVHIRTKSLHRAGSELWKVLDENQKVCYNKLVDLCEN